VGLYHWEQPLQGEAASIASRHLQAFSAAKEARDRALPVRARKTGRSHEIMIPRSGGGGQEVNSRKADEVFAEHGAVLPIPPSPSVSRFAGTSGHPGLAQDSDVPSRFWRVPRFIGLTSKNMKDGQEIRFSQEQ
jgi:hypothetical protein